MEGGSRIYWRRKLGEIEGWKKEILKGGSKTYWRPGSRRYWRVEVGDIGVEVGYIGGEK